MLEALEQNEVGLRKLRNQRILADGHSAHKLVFFHVKDNGSDSPRREEAEAVRAGAVRLEAVPVVLDDGGVQAVRCQLRQQALDKPGFAGIFDAGNGVPVPGDVIRGVVTGSKGAEIVLKNGL